MKCNNEQARDFYKFHNSSLSGRLHYMNYLAIADAYELDTFSIRAPSDATDFFEESGTLTVRNEKAKTPITITPQH